MTRSPDRSLASLLVAIIALPAAVAAAGDGTWTGASGDWSNPLIWTGGLVADGVDATASLTADITADRTVFVDAAVTVGTVVFEDLDASTPFGLTLGGTTAGSLTLATISATPVIDVRSPQLTVSAVVGGSQGFAKTGPGMLTLSGDANTISGSLALREGALQIAGDSSLGQVFEIVVENPFELYSDQASPVTIGQTRYLTLDAGLTVRGADEADRQIAIAASIVGTGGLALAGTTTDLALTGPNSFSGPITIAAGGSAGGSSNNTTLVVGAGAADSLSSLGNGNNTVTLGGRGIGVGDSTLHFNLADYTFAGPIGGDGRVRIDSDDSGYAQGSTISLTGTNTYTGITEIRKSALLVRDPVALAPATVVFNAEGMLLIGTDLDPGSPYDFTRPVGTGSEDVRWNSGGGFGAVGADRSVNLFGDGRQLVWNEALFNWAALFLSHPDADATVELVNGLGLTGTGRRNMTISDGSADIDAVISGVIAEADGVTANVGLNISGTGTLVLTGLNTYRGGTEVLGSTVVAQTIQSGGPSNLGTGYLAVKQGGTFRYTGTGSETFTKGLWLDNGVSRFDIVDPAAVLTFDPNQGTRNKQLVKLGDGAMVLTKAISGTGSVLVEEGVLELTASNNSYTGVSRVTGGTLKVSDTGVVSSNQVVLEQAGSFDVTAKTAGYEAPATQVIQGFGTIAGSLVLGGGATVEPGGPAPASGLGTLSITQNATFGPGGNYNWRILDATPGGAGQSTGWSLLSLGGGLTVSATAADPFRLNLWSLFLTNPDESGPALNFDPTQSGSWTVVSTTTGITGFAADAFLISTDPANGTGGFANDLAGGTFGLAVSGTNLNLVFSPAGSSTDIVIDVPSGSQTQAAAGYPTIASATSLTKTGNGTLVFDAANGYTGPTTISAGTLQVANAGALAATPVTVNTGGTLAVATGTQMKGPAVIVDGGTLSAGAVAINNTTGIASLAINAGTIAGSPTVAIGAGGQMALVQDARVTVSVGGLSVEQTTGGGRLDLGAGQVTIGIGGISAADLRADIIAGRNGGGWNGGTGITSSTAAASAGGRAVGYVVAADGSAKVSFAAPGDVDLSGAVNVFDLVGVNSGGKYGAGTAAVWNQGDFNYDGVTNVFDLVSVNTAGAYGQGNYFPAAPSTSSAVSAVPEPGCLPFLAGGIAALATLRRHRRAGGGT
jgi:fibronectin-binding autotransporter adhesin